MKKSIQTRLHKGMDNEKDRGNCFPTVISCFLDLDSPEDCIQIQEYYISDPENWVIILDKWLQSRGWELGELDGHQNDDSFYLVTGNSPRGNCHVVIYKNGELWHDPHPSESGLVTFELFEYLIPK